MYSPQMLDNHVRRLYKIKEYYGLPMTIIHNAIVDVGLQLLEDQIKEEKNGIEKIIERFRGIYPEYTEESLVRAANEIKMKYKNVDAIDRKSVV